MTVPTTTTETRETTPTRPPARKAWWRRDGTKGLAFSAPTAVVVVLFFVVPLILVGWMSLNRWPLLGSPSFNFPANYGDIAEDPLFFDAVWFTLKYTVIVTVLLTLVAFGLVLLVQERRRGVGLLRTAYFIPGAIGFATASLLFYGFFGELGPLDTLFGSYSLLGSHNSALGSTIAMVIWRFAGFFMLILLTGLQGIPVDLFEAARVDGAGRWQVLRYITLPLLRPTIALMLVLSITGSLLAFDQFFILTRGGPDNSTVTLVMVIYREAFVRFDLGGAAALSVVLLAGLVVLNVLQLRVLRRKGDG